MDEIDLRLAANHDDTVFGWLVVDEPGVSVGYCSVPEHHEAGMEIEMVITPSNDSDDHSPPFDFQHENTGYNSHDHNIRPS